MEIIFFITNIFGGKPYNCLFIITELEITRHIIKSLRGADATRVMSGIFREAEDINISLWTNTRSLCKKSYYLQTIAKLI